MLRRPVATVAAVALLSLSCMLGFAAPALAAGPYVVTTAGGTGSAAAPVAGPVTASPIAHPQAMTADTAGNVWVFVTAGCRVVKVTAAGVLSVVAGNGTCAATGTAGTALSQPLSTGVKSLAVDGSGNLFIGDTTAARIFKVTPGGAQTVFAGTGGTGAPNLSGAATASAIVPDSLAVDGSGNLYVGYVSRPYVLRITAAGQLSKVIGTGTAGATNLVLGAAAAVNQPVSLAIDAVGAVYIGDAGNRRIIKVLAGTASNVAGTGALANPVAGSLTSPVPYPYAMTIDSAGTLFVAEGYSRQALSFTTLGLGAPTLVASPPGPSTALAATAADTLMYGDPDNNVLLRIAPPTVPDAPTGLSATPGPNSATLAFTAPATGGSTITGYQYTTTGGLTWAALPADRTLTGLLNGVTYTVQVRAVNAIGTGPASTGTTVTPATTPGVPLLVTATGGDTTITLNFSPPAADGGSPVTAYDVSLDAGATWQAVTTTDVLLAKTATITGLTNATAYAVQLRARNAVGPGPASGAVAATPRGSPDAPAALTGTPGNGQATLTFTTPGDGGYPILYYQVSADDGATWATQAVTTAGSTATMTVTGLTNGTTYPFRVRAVNLAGASAPSAATSIALAARVPDAPTGLVATTGSTTVTVTFQPPASDGGRTISGYEASVDNGVSWSPVSVSDVLLAKTTTIGGLTNGTTYAVRLRARNPVGPGAASTSVSATPTGVPYAPTGLAATAGNTQAVLTFTTPGDGGFPILSYQVSTDDGSTWIPLAVTTNGTTNTGTVTGLTNGTTYPVRVRALSLAGAGAASTAVSVTPPVVPPDAPTGLLATGGDETITVAFTPPSGALTGYEVSTNDGATWAPITVTGVLGRTGTVTGLVNGVTYAVRVRARNTAGPGAASAAASATPRGAPYAPGGLTATPGNTQATLTFTTPGDGGNALLGYQVSTDDGANWTGLAVTTNGTTNTGTVTGLTNGTTYPLRVRAYNLAGPGAASAAVPAALPALAPAAPTGLVVTAGDTTAGLAFQPPATTGGSPITGYQVSTDGGATWAPITVTGGLLASTATVTGLINGSAYAVALRAVNAVGPGPATAPVTVTPRGAPYAPTGLTATPGDSQATITFTTPGDGGNPILAYQVSTDDGATWTPIAVTTAGTSNTATVTGLVNGTTYPIRVRAGSLAGFGAPSARATVALPLLPPGAPAGLVAVAGSEQVTVTFQPPAATGGAPVTSYDVSVDNGVTWYPITVTDTLLAKTTTVTGLTNGTAYAIRLRARNAAGTGPASAAVSATPAGVPYAPPDLTATAGANQATLTFTTPADGGNAILFYQASTDDGTTWTNLPVTTSGATTTGTVTGLSPGSTYAFRVRAVNLAGPGAPSDGVGLTLPALVPGTPGTILAVAGDARITLAFTAPATGGSPITSYQVSADDGATWAALAADRVVTGLTNGTTYALRVRAVNAVGAGPAGTAPAVTPRGTPYAPADLTAVPGNGSADLTFTVPGDGGYSILGYQASADGVTWTALAVTTSGTTGTATMTGLTNGIAYPIRVRARNLLGAGAASSRVTVTPATVPGAPAGVAAAPGNTEATVTFTPPASDGGAPVTSYEVSTDDATWSPLPATGLVTGLTNGTTYQVRVRALNVVGAGPASAAATVTPVPDTPDAPTGLSAARGDASATLTFTPPVSTGAGPITGYQVSVDNGATWAALAAGRVVTGLTNGTTYTVKVRAVNASGAGPASASTTVTPATVPGAPAGLSVAAGDTQAVLSFAAPASTGGDPITSYEVSVDDAATWTALAADRTVTGLTNGTSYRFRVRAVNSVGTGPPSARVDATPARTPGAPTAVTATAGDRRAVVSFTDPADDGGAPITGHQVSTDDGATWAVLPAGNTVTGLDNGTTYTLRVRAVNRIGPGPASGSATVTPDDGRPGAPTGLTATRGDASAALAFTPPAGPVTGYDVSTDGGVTWNSLPAGRIVTGLTNGTTYAMQVRARTAAGAGPSSNRAEVTPATVPGAPAALTATPGNRSLTLAVTAPADDGGDPVTSYQVSTDDGATWAALAADRVVTGLTNGTPYTVRVRAVNSVGPGAPGASVTATPATSADAPAGLSAQRGNASATLTFTAPADTGGNPVTSYQVSTDDGATWAALAADRVVTGLTNGVTYTVRVRAITSSGPGAASTATVVTPATTPDAPATLTASPGDRSTSLIFPAPADGGDQITSYEVSVDDGSTWAGLPADAIVTGLTNGTAYPIRVRAVNGLGAGPAGPAVTVTPVSGLPGVPADVTATRGDASVTLAFTAPPGPVTGYQYSTDAGATWSPLAADRVVGGLVNGTTYTFWVRACNAAGTGPASPGVSATPARAPDAPTGLAATPGDTTAGLLFTPGDDGGDTVTRFEVSTDDGGTWAALASDGVVTGLVNGTTYTVRVRAVNTAGTSPPSASTTVTPDDGRPGAPTGLTATRGNASATLSFTPPAGPVTGYDVSADGGVTWSPLSADRVVTGLTNGAVYTFQVRARTAAGPGPASAGVTVLPATTPPEPAGLTATPADSAARLAFAWPGDDGGSPVTGYQVSVDDGRTWSALTVTGTAALTATVTGLSNGVAYPIRVRAVNDVGGGTPSTAATVTPRTTPGAPASLNAAAGDGQAVLMVAAPGSDGGSPIIGYEVSTDDGATWATLAADRTVTGLTNGTVYTVRVRALNAAGPGPASGSVDVAPVAGLPGAPTGLTATRGDSSAALAFTAPAGPVTSYEVSTDDGWNWAPLAADRVVLALTNGTTYPIRVRAVNATGAGPASGSATVTPAAAPGQPAGLQAQPGNGSATLTFTAPGTGGSPITGYQVSADDGATWAALAADRTVTGLTNGTVYTVRVRAFNAVGTGPASAGATVTPAAVPGAPTGLAATAADRSATLTFAAPADTGGSVVTRYDVSADDGATWAALPANRTVTGLVNGTTYTVRVRAVNGVGPGPASAGVTVTPAAVPGAPAGLSATPGNGRLTLAFTAPAGPVTSYEVSADGGATWGPLGADRIVTGLTNGTSYTVRVRAVNATGTGPASAAVTATPVTVPAGPSDLRVTPGDSSVSVSFTAPADTGGSPITSYDVSADDGATWAALPADQLVTGLANGTTYLIRVRARNAAGPGAPSANATATPVGGLPAMPAGFAVARGDTSATVTFTPGGGPVTGYQVSTDDGVTWTALPSGGRITGLTNGVTYAVRMRAVNDNGFSPPTVAVEVTPATTPGEPSGLVATRGDRSATLTFTPPAGTGGSPITRYEVSTDGTTWATLPANGVVTGLTNGVTYTVSVRARNDVGPGPAASTTVTPLAVPGAPTGLSAARGNGSATLTFTAPADTGGNPITGYQVSTDGGGTWAALAANRVVTGLTNGTTYAVRVRALNSIGPGPAGPAAPVTPVTIPGAPGGLTAAAGDGTATLTFTAPADTGGDPITGYQVSTDDGGTWSALAANRVVTGLTDGTTYAIRVRARNSVGLGAPSAAASVTPLSGLPGAPGDVVVDRGDASITVTVTPPGTYQVSLDDGRTWTALPAGGRITGLGNGTTYAVRVRRINDVGPGPAGAAVSVTPATVPGAPTALTASAGDASASVAFTAPASDGGAPVTGYQVSTDDGRTWRALPAGRIVTGLANGTTYTIRVRAVNDVGPGPAGAAITVTPVSGLPGAPTGVTVSRGDSSLTVTFTPGGGDPIGHEVSTDGGTTWAPLAADGVVAGLTNGVSYVVSVRAVNAAGRGPATAGVTGVPSTVPGEPTVTGIVVTDTTATVTFAAPTTTGGAPITGYQVSVDDGATWNPLAVTGTGPYTGTITGLTAGVTYVIVVRAVNVAGPGPASQNFAAAPAPSAPADVAVSRGDGTLTVTFTPPDDETVTGFQVSLDGGATWSGLAASGVVTGLDNTATYAVQVRAVNASGPGRASPTVTSAPAAPGAARDVTVVAGTSSIEVTWAAPAATAVPVTAYRVVASPGPATCTTGPEVTSCRLGATAGVSYTVRVVSVAAGGVTTTSEPSAAVVPLAPTVPATPPDTSLSLTTTRGDIDTATPGEEIVLVGTGFAAYSTVTVVVYSTPRVLGTVVTDGDGAFRYAVRLPADLATGAHTLLATGVDPDGRELTRELSFTVAAATAAPSTPAPAPSTPLPSPSPPGTPAPPGGPGWMPRTGADIALVAAAGLLMVVSGAAMLLVRRRPRR